MSECAWTASPVTPKGGVHGPEMRVRLGICMSVRLMPAGDNGHSPSLSVPRDVYVGGAGQMFLFVYTQGRVGYLGGRSI